MPFFSSKARVPPSSVIQSMEESTPFFSSRSVVVSMASSPICSFTLLQKSSSPDVVFIASRILFLCTASSATAGSFIVSLVERKPSGRAHTLVEILGLRLESLTTALLSGTRMAREAMVDLLKFAFNVLTHYPKVRFVSFSFFLSSSLPSSSTVRELLRATQVKTMPK
jgi:hypothetical protein